MIKLQCIIKYLPYLLGAFTCANHLQSSNYRVISRACATQNIKEPVKNMFNPTQTQDLKYFVFYTINTVITRNRHTSAAVALTILTLSIHLMIFMW